MKKIKTVNDFKKYMISFWFKEYIPLKEENKQLKLQLKKSEVEAIRYREMALSLSKQKQLLQRKIESK